MGLRGPCCPTWRTKGLCADLSAEIRLLDYRDVDEQFNRRYSIDVPRPIGHKYCRTYMEAVERNFESGALHLAHSAGSEDCSMKADTWVNRYLFPSSHIPSPKQIIYASKDVPASEDWHTFTQDYDHTFMRQHANLSFARDELSNKIDEKLKRLQQYYLPSFAGVFRSRISGLRPVVFSNAGASWTAEHIR